MSAGTQAAESQPHEGAGVDAAVRANAMTCERLALQLAALLGDARVPTQSLPTVRAAAEAWSRAVWREALAAGALAPHPDGASRAEALLARPVFVCGTHRSGTTLMRNLLDGHPQLLVLPSEGLRPAALAQRLRLHGDDDARDGYGQEWLRRLANPINLPPYWILDRPLGRPPGTGAMSFARALLGWWPWCRQRYAGRHPLWPTMAVLLAYGSCGDTGRLRPQWQCWVEKTPTNEVEADALLGWFPGARIVQLVRAPRDVLASRRGLASAGGVPWRAVRDLRRSYVCASRAVRAGRTSRHAVIRYEQLVATPDATMNAVATFLGIEAGDSLLRSTVNGLEAPANSSFSRGDGRGAILTGRVDGPSGGGWREAVMRAWLAHSMWRLGYRWSARRRNWRMK